MIMQPTSGDKRISEPSERPLTMDRQERATFVTDNSTSSNHSATLDISNESPSGSAQSSACNNPFRKFSANIQEAQNHFRSVVKNELNSLIQSGIERERAIQKLLERIVERYVAPVEDEVQEVMRTFRLNHEDAIRALIVKQELGRLKRRGLDPLAAIEELTRKMQGATVICSEEAAEVQIVEERSSESADKDAQNTREETVEKRVESEPAAEATDSLNREPSPEDEDEMQAFDQSPPHPSSKSQTRRRLTDKTSSSAEEKPNSRDGHPLSATAMTPELGPASSSHASLTTSPKSLVTPSSSSRKRGFADAVGSGEDLPMQPAKLKKPREFKLAPSTFEVVSRFPLKRARGDAPEDTEEPVRSKPKKK